MLKINKLEIENVKRVKAVKIEPTENGLTIIGGKNGQGKTSVLDAIAWGLGGNKYKPSQAERVGSVTPPNLHIVMSNGLEVRREGKNSDLKVLDPSGNKAGQQLLNSFVEELAIDLPKFMESSSKEKADTLLQIIGVGDQLLILEQQENELYNQRHTIGQIADQKKKFATEMPYFDNAPKELVSASELISQQQDILAKNGENQRLREQRDSLRKKHQEILNEILQLQEKETKLSQQLEIAEKSALDLHDESTEELEKNIQQIDEINRKVRTNLDKDKAEDDAQDYGNQYEELSAKIEEIRKQKQQLLNSADLPLEGLFVTNGELIYNNQRWDNMSSSEQLKVSTAIVRQLKPECGFILIDKLEQMDLETLNEFGKWLESENLQAIATRVSTGDECEIIIEDGYATEPIQSTQKPAQMKWK